MLVQSWQTPPPFKWRQSPSAPLWILQAQFCQSWQQPGDWLARSCCSWADDGPLKLLHFSVLTHLSTAGEWVRLTHECLLLIHAASSLVDFPQSCHTGCNGLVSGYCPSWVPVSNDYPSGLWSGSNTKLLSWLGCLLHCMWVFFGGQHHPCLHTADYFVTPISGQALCCWRETRALWPNERSWLTCLVCLRARQLSHWCSDYWVRVFVD